MAAKREPKLAPLPYGDGTLRWNADRQRVELLHTIDGTRYTERDATRQGAILKRDQRRARRNLADNGVATVATVAAGWLAVEAVGKPESTATLMRWGVDRIAEAFGPDTPIADVTVADVEAVYSAWIAGGLGVASMAKLRSYLKRVFARAYRHGLTLTDPAAIAVTPPGATSARDAVWLDAAEAADMTRYLAANGSTIATMLLVELTTGMRPAEAAGLAWADVDLDTARAKVTHAITRTHGGRRRALTEVLKTPASYRTLALPAVTVAALRRHHVTQSVARLAASTWADKHGLAFVADDGAGIGDDEVERFLAASCKAVGAKRITSNSLRHTFASLALHHGVGVADVAKAMGHTDSRMVTTTYGHAMVDVVDVCGMFDAMAVGE